MSDERVAVSDWYRRFSADEAHGRSPLYEALAAGVADDADILAFLLTLPPAKRQPNLLLGAVRHLFGTPRDWAQFRTIILGNGNAISTFMLTHATQTNEPGRCAVLLPVLARLPQPLALIEVGAAAGLCLLPDFYAYDYGVQRVHSANPDAPVFACRASAPMRLPSCLPRIVWRAGLDLSPIDIADAEQTAWLITLVWPEQVERVGRLKAALAIAAHHTPRVIKADLLTDKLEALCREAPKDATLVIFHTAVLPYVVDPARRAEFGRRAMAAARYWISNEGHGFFPDIAKAATPSAVPGRFLLAVNGAPVAWTDPHGAAMEWIADADWTPPPAASHARAG